MKLNERIALWLLVAIAAFFLAAWGRTKMAAEINAEQDEAFQHMVNVGFRGKCTPTPNFWGVYDCKEAK